MAPEQALGRRVVVDHRVDIYALGASLYELLAFRPPLDGSSREALLKQIAFEEPKSLRHFNGAVPEDLQTIVHKALSKNPDERYATAQEMADDLHAFVAGEPIKARPLSIAQHATNWAAKRKGLVAAVAGALILTVIGLLTGNAMITQQRNVALEAEHKARTKGLEADQQRKLAESNAKAARETVDKYLTKVSENELLDAPSMQPLRKDLLQLALKYYLEFVQERQNDPSLRAELAATHFRVAKILTKLGSTEEARKALESALVIWEALVAEQPRNADPPFAVGNAVGGSAQTDWS